MGIIQKSVTTKKLVDLLNVYSPVKCNNVQDGLSFGGIQSMVIWDIAIFG